MVPNVDIITAQCKTSGYDITGTAKSGHLVLRGRIFETSLSYGLNDLYHYHTFCKSNEWLDDQFTKFYSVVKADVFELDCSLDYAAWEPGVDHLPESSTVTTLFFFVPGDRSVDLEQRYLPWTLLLLKQLSTNTYERLGIVLSWHLHTWIREEKMQPNDALWSTSMTLRRRMCILYENREHKSRNSVPLCSCALRGYSAV